MTLALPLGLAAIGVFGTLAGGVIGMWSGRLIERSRQVFEREQEGRRQRAQSMVTARILDSALMEAEALLKTSVVEDNRLWTLLLVVKPELIRSACDNASRSADVMTV